VAFLAGPARWVNGPILYLDGGVIYGAHRAPTSPAALTIAACGIVPQHPENRVVDTRKGQGSRPLHQHSGRTDRRLRLNGTRRATRPSVSQNGNA
jgi:hypothetical protein